MEKPNNLNRKCRKVGSYILLQQIGKGSYSNVFQARRGSAGPYYAVKQISLVDLREKDLQRIHQQLNVLSLLKHPNIVQLIDFKQTSRHIYLVFEHCKFTDLAGYINKNKKNNQECPCLPQKTAEQVMCKLRDAFIQLRKHRIIHRDIKLGNILVTEDFQVKLADFGFAKFLQQNQFSKSVVGTHLTMAPQVMQHRQYNQKCDIWSLGTVAYQMLFGCSPFFKKDRLTKTEIRQSLKQPVQFPKQICDEAKDLIKRMLVHNPQKRMSFAQFFQHPWLNSKQANIKQKQKVIKPNQLFRTQALQFQLIKSVPKSTRSALQKQYIMQNCQNIISYSLFQFVKNYLQNNLTIWLNLGKKLLDNQHHNKRLTFLSLAVLLDNINKVLSRSSQILLNANRIIKLPPYLQLRKLQSWPMTQFSQRLPDFISKSRRHIEEYLHGQGAVKFTQSDGQGRLTDLLIRQLKKQTQNDQEKNELKIFLKVRQWQNKNLCINAQSGMLSQSAVTILVKILSLKVQYHQLCKKCSGLFKFTVINEPSEFQMKLQELKQSILQEQ